MNKWISVKKTMPLPLKTVLFYTISDTMFIGWLACDGITIHPAQQGESLNVAFVTHWRPLPKAPKFV